MPGLFVTATGTEVGKTFVTAGLIRAARRAGHAVDALKPVLSGFADESAAESDAGALLAALDRPLTKETLSTMSPLRFRAPLSPDMAAAAEERTIEFAEVVATCRRVLASERLVFVEGVGGVMVPLDGDHTVLDLAAALAVPVVLVAPTALGAISHLLTARAVLVARGVAIATIVLNESAGSTVPIQATRTTLARFCHEPIEMLPRDADAVQFDALFAALARIIPMGNHRI